MGSFFVERIDGSKANASSISAVAGRDSKVGRCQVPGVRYLIDLSVLGSVKEHYARGNVRFWAMRASVDAFERASHVLLAFCCHHCEEDAAFAVFHVCF